MQNGNTRTMIFGVRKLVSYRQPLHHAAPGRHHQHRHAAGRGPGDEAGTRVPKVGQTMRLGIEGLGEQTQRVVQG